jgi:hypothetical protein
MVSTLEKKDKDKERVTLPPDLGEFLAILDGREPTEEDRISIEPDENLLTVSTFIAGQMRKRPARFHLVPNPGRNTPKVGDPVFNDRGKCTGYYVGTWEPKDGNESLGSIFDLYVAPTDILNSDGTSKLLTHERAVTHVSRKRCWHGHHGLHIEKEQDLIKLILEGRLQELNKWFIPPFDVLEQNIYANRNHPSLKQTFNTESGMGSINIYRSCSEHIGRPTHVCNIKFQNSVEYLVYPKEQYELPTRPVRAVLKM